MLQQAFSLSRQGLGLHGLPGQAPVDRLFGADARAGHHQSHGPMPAQGARQQPAGSSVRRQTHLGEGVGQKGRTRHEDHVGGQGDGRPCPDRRPVHRRDHGNRQVRQLEQQGVDVAFENGSGVIGQRLGQRAAGAEGPARSGDHQRSCSRNDGGVDGGRQRLDHGFGQGVHPLRLVQADNDPCALSLKTDHHTPRRAARPCKSRRDRRKNA
ncbi:hypothetical protein D3C73_847290 [compost metagenome]